MTCMLERVGRGTLRLSAHSKINVRAHTQAHNHTRTLTLTVSKMSKRMIMSKRERDVMSEYERETAFLRHVIHFDNTSQCRELDEKIADVERDGRSVLR